MARFVEMGMAVRQDDPKVWVGRRIDFKGARGESAWFEVDRGSTVTIHLRSVLRNQFVFDLGDLQPGDPPEGDWLRCRRDYWAVSTAMTRLHVPGLVSLTAGKGVHIEVFLPVEGPQSRCQDRSDDPQSDWRWPIALRIIAEANLLLFEDTLTSTEPPIHFDHLLIAPNEGSRLIREFNEGKDQASKRVKMLWHEGYGPFPELPATRDEAYAQAKAKAAVRGSARPQQPIPIAVDAETFDTRWIAELFPGKSCPKSTDCYAPKDGWPHCDENCPALGAD